MEYRADLHIHSYFSDGTDDPFTLIDKAKKHKLSAISITDHDTIKAYSKDLFDYAAKQGIFLLTGIEISSRCRKEDVHILAYNIDVHSSDLQSFLVQVQRQREERNKKICQKLQSQGFAFSYSELEKLGVEIIGRPHIANLLIKKGYAKDYSDAFKRFLRENASAYVPSDKFSPIEVINQIHLAKGKAVIAHPHFIKSQKVISDLLAMPFDGIEGHYSAFSEKENAKWINIGKEKKWIVTGGSDYHGEIKPHVFIGVSYVGKDVIDHLRK